MSKTTVKAAIDTEIINKTEPLSITRTSVGGRMKDVVDLIPEQTEIDKIHTQNTDLGTTSSVFEIAYNTTNQDQEGFTYLNFKTLQGGISGSIRFKWFDATPELNVFQYNITGNLEEELDWVDFGSGGALVDGTYGSVTVSSGGTIWTVNDVDWESISGRPAFFQSVVAGTNISIDNTDPINPTVNFVLDADENFVTDAEKTVIGNTSGTNSGNETAATIGTIINSATNYTTPLNADKIGIWDTLNSLYKAVTWANIKATLKTYFDTLYATTAQANATHTGDVTGATALTIANNVVTNTKAAQMAANTIKSNATGSTANAQDVAITAETVYGRTAGVNSGNLAPILLQKVLSGRGTTDAAGVLTIVDANITATSIAVATSLLAGSTMTPVFASGSVTFTATTAAIQSFSYIIHT